MEHLNYTIRDITEADMLPVLKMQAQSWLDTYPNEAADVPRKWVQERVDGWLTDESMSKRRGFIEKSGSDPDTLYRVAETKNGEIIGIVVATRSEDKQRVGALYVDKAYQGLGVAQRLMDQIISWANPLQPLELEVVEYNGRARAFYRKYDFKEIDNSEHISHEILPVITMERKGVK